MSNTRCWERYVAVGDSFTEGLVDPVPGDPDHFRGWADRLANRLARRNAEEDLPFGYANLAVRGLRAEAIVGPQLDAALALTPDLVSLSAGGNDYLRARVDPDEVTDRVEEAVVRIRETGADVLLTTGPNVSWMPVVNRMHARMAQYTADMWGIAQRNDCYMLDIWSLRSLRDLRMYGEDRIHFSSEGHARVAAQAAWTLGIPSDVDDWRLPLPPSPPLPLLASVQANRDWALTHLAPWVRRRLVGASSGDGRSAKRPEVTPLDHRE